MKKYTISLCLILMSVFAFSQWTEINSNSSLFLKSVFFVDSNNGYASGGSANYILKTIDGGQTWNSLTIYLGAADFFDVFFTNVNTGYAVDANFGKIYKTIDGGSNWTQVLAGSTYNTGLRSIEFVSPNIGFAVGDSGKIYKTMNAGSNWTLYAPAGTFNYLNSVHFINSNTGYIVGWNGTILKTIDAGATWMTLNSGTSYSLFDVYFTDINTGYAVGEYGTVRKTINGGANWTDKSLVSFNDRLQSVFFTDVNTGYVSDQFANKILKTTNGGNSWTSSLNTSGAGIWSICFIDSVNGYAVGANGKIYTTTTGGFFLNLNETNGGINDTLTVYSYPVTIDAGSDWLNYNWNNGSSSQTTIVNNNGWYSVTVSSSAKLTLTDSIYVTLGTNISQNSIYENVILNPNPSNGRFFIETTNNEIIEKIEIYNLLGKLVYSTKTNSNQSAYPIDISSNPNGIYVLKINSKGKYYTNKIILQN